MDRNNTSFLKQLVESIKAKKINNKDILQYHQRIVHDYVLSDIKGTRGILAYHEMGSGKTILANSIAHDLYKQGKKVIFFSSKILHKNFLVDYQKYLSLIGESGYQDNIKMITLTANNMIEQLYENENSLNDSLVIVDEAHNFFNGITNGSKNYTGLYNAIMKAKNIKLLFLTGSPITNDPFEIALCFNMLSGYDLFGEDYIDFHRYFIQKAEIDTIKNADKFSNRIVGLVSYYGTDQANISKYLPEKLKPIVFKIPMSTQEYAEYVSARDKEQEESKFSLGKRINLQKPQGTTSSYRVRSRQISNMIFPKNNNKIEFFEKLEEYSPKLHKLMLTLTEHFTKFKDFCAKLKSSGKSDKLQGPGIIYSQFIDFGVEIIAQALEYFGMTRIINSSDFGKKYSNGCFAIVSGEVKEDFRAEIIKQAKNPDNIEAEYLSLLLITATGAEGINTKNMMHVHVFEPFWHWSRIEQVFSRAIRLNSHMDLPENKRKVQPYIYLSDYPTKFEDKEQAKLKLVEQTTDIHLYNQSIKNQLLIRSFLNVLKQTSIDCSIMYKERKCKMCSPTDQPLFIEDLNKDMKSKSTCVPITEKKIKAESIIIEDESGKREYMYTLESGLHIFQYDKNINAYREIFEDNPDYYNIKNLMNKS